MTAVATLAEFKTHLRRTDTDDDTALTMFLNAASTVVETILGGPLSVTSFTESAQVRGSEFIAPTKRPLVAVTSLTRDLGGAVINSANYTTDLTRNVVRLYRDIPHGWYTLVYTAGLATILDNVKLGGLIIGQHLWQVENGGGGLPFPGDVPLVVVSGFTIPRRAAELLDAGDDGALTGFA